MLLLDEPEAHLDMARRERLGAPAGRVRRRGGDDQPRPAPARRGGLADRGARQRPIRMWPGNYSAYVVARAARAGAPAPGVRRPSRRRSPASRTRSGGSATGRTSASTSAPARAGARQADADRPHGEGRPARVRAAQDGARAALAAPAAASACSPWRASTPATATILCCSTSSSSSPAASGSASSAPTAAARRPCCASSREDLEPLAGTRWAGDGITLGYLSQAANALDDDATVLEALQSGRSLADDQAVRLLMAFLFDYEQTRRPVGSLSAAASAPASPSCA